MGSIAQSAQFTSGTIQTLQVTLGTGATQVVGVRTFVRQALIQNNAGHNCRVGDSNVSATRGALLLSTANGSINLGEVNNYGEIDLSSVWLFGTANDIIDVIFVI